MSKKVGLIIASVLVALGTAVCGVALVMANGDVTKIGFSDFQTKEYEISKEFSGISVSSMSADIRFQLSEDGKTRVVCFEKESVSHSVSVKEGVLTIQATDKREWYEHIWNFGNEMLTVYLPEISYGALTIEADTSDVQIRAPFRFESVNISLLTGDIDLERVNTGSMELSVSTGEISLEEITCTRDITVGVSTGETEIERVTCKNLSSKGGTGNIELSGVIVSEKMTMERSTGDITFENSDAAELSIRTRTGDVEGTLLTGKNFQVKTGTGRVRVPEGQTGGLCEITTGTGDIRITVRGN